MKITNEEQLRELYGWPKGRASIKVINSLEKHSINFIKHSPFLVLSTYDKQGRCDASPRGGQPGFVSILDNQTLLIPDAKGNNRVDSLVNIVETGSIGLLFFIPGIDETLRINGTASISAEEIYIQRFSQMGKRPKSCVRIKIDEVFLHCAKALMRSKLWNAAAVLNRSEFPTMGRMLNDQLGTNNQEETQEEMIKRYLPDL